MARLPLFGRLPKEDDRSVLQFPNAGLHDLDPANDIGHVTNFVQEEVDVLKQTNGSFSEAVLRISDHVTTLASDFRSRAIIILDEAFGTFDNQRTLVEDMQNDDGADAQELELRERVQQKLADKAGKLAMAEQQKRLLEPQIRGLRYGIFGSPELGAAYKLQPTWRKFAEFGVIFTCMLLLEFFMNFDLMQTISNKPVAIATSVSLALIVTFFVDLSANRFRAYQNHLGAVREFNKRHRSADYQDRQAGKVSVFPLEPLFWVTFWLPHLAFVGVIVGLVWFRCQVILSERFHNWGGMIGTVIMTGILIAYYVYKAMFMKDVVHPRMRELMDVQEELEAVTDDLDLLNAGQDDDTLAIRKDVNAFVAERRDSEKRLHAALADLKRAQANFVTVHGQILGKLPSYGRMLVSAVHSLRQAVVDHPSEFEDVDTTQGQSDGVLMDGIQRHLELNDPRYQTALDYAVPSSPKDTASGISVDSLVRQHWDEALRIARAEVARIATAARMNQPVRVTPVSIG